MYDTIVVGAGPAGSTAAIVLAKNGLRTLIVDRESFPREKACGDAVPSECFEILNELGITFQESETFLPINQVYIEGPRGANLTLNLSQRQFDAAIISRYVFDNTLLERAKQCGAEFCEIGVSGPIVEDGRVVGVKGKDGKQAVEYRAKVVIAADGATSVIARAFNGAARADHTTAVALRGYIETDVDLARMIELVFLRDVIPGYAWFFPTGKRRANIGVGMRSDVYKRQNKSLQEMLDVYLKMPEIKARVGDHTVTGVKSWQVPLCITDQKRVFDGAILAGDAGNFVDPLSGAGIYQAVVTGKRAAETATQAIRRNDTSATGLSDFERLWREDLGSDLKRSAFVYRMVCNVPSLIDAALVIGKRVPAIMPKLLGKL